MNLLTAKMDDEDEALSSSEPAVAHHQSMDFELTTSTVTATTAATADANDDDINDEEVFTSSELSPHAAAAAAVTGTESLCRVCGDGGAGIYFGAVVCVPCKVSLPLFVFLSVFICCLSLSEQDIMVPPLQCNHYVAIILALTRMALGHFGTKNDTVLPLRHLLLWRARALEQR